VANVQLHPLHGDGLSGLADNSFDVVYCTNTLAHLDELDRWRYVQDAFRVLRSGGRIFLDNIDLASDQGWAMFLNLVAKYHNAELPPYMTRFSSATELMTYGTRAGFAHVQAHHKAPLVIVTAVKPSIASPC
jgi:ubiquinone/menaquinone biosynthesis C-methylase UbiE